jgi:hypothetical protein
VPAQENRGFMTSTSKIGWTLALIGFLMLLWLGTLDLLALMIPLAAVLAYGIVCLDH